MSNLYFPICALFISSLLLIIFFSKERINILDTKLFSFLLIVNFLDSLLNTIIIYLGYTKPTGITLIKILNRIDFPLYILWAWLFFLYIFHISTEKKKTHNLFKIIFNISLVINIIAILFSIILPFEIQNSNNIMYAYGNSVNVLYIICGIYMFLTLFCVLLNIKRLLNKKYAPVYVLILFAFIIGYIRLINPSLILISAVISYINLVLYFTIENPDMKMLEEVNKAKKISDNANQEKSMFLFNMTKEIRNISRNIDDHADNILSEVSKEETNIENIGDNAREIKYDISKFNTMTNDILDVSNIDASNIKIYNTKFNIKLIIKGLVSIYKEKCQEKGLEFRTDIASDIPEYLYGDSINLKKVMITLLDNAIKYTNNGYVELSVNFVKKLDICRLIISIEDSGIGIKPEELDTIFYKKKEELNRNNLKNNLYTAKKIITMMEGTIIANSDYNKGTTMKIVLDAKIVPTKENVYIKEYDNKKILLVDDSETCEKIIKKILRGSNITIERTEYGKYCLDKIRSKEKYDLILIKDELKPLDGYTIMTKLQEIRNFNIPCILLTKNTNVEYDDSYQKYGFKDYIIKSNDKNKILNTLDKYLK